MLDKDDPWLRDVSDKDVVDPLTPVARSDRNSLLICNLLVFAVFQVNIVPTRLSIAGAETNDFAPGAIKVLALVLLAYFATAFASAIGAEYRAWRANWDGLRDRRELRALLSRAEPDERRSIPYVGQAPPALCRPADFSGHDGDVAELPGKA